MFKDLYIYIYIYIHKNINWWNGIHGRMSEKRKMRKDEWLRSKKVNFVRWRLLNIPFNLIGLHSYVNISKNVK